jgi:predicted nucleic acid-binding protein
MEKETLVLDASVIVKWFCEEEYTDIALRIRDGFFKGELDVVVSGLMFYEVSNAIRHNKALSTEDKLSVVDDLFSIDFDVMEDKRILSRAMKLALDTDTPIYDNVYLATARLRKCNFITADKEYADNIDTKDVIFIGDWKR